MDDYIKKWNGKEYDASKFDDVIGNRLEDLEVGDVAVSWEVSFYFLIQFHQTKMQKNRQIVCY